MTKKHDVLFANVLDDIDSQNGQAADKRAKRPGHDPHPNRFITRSSALADRLNGDVIEKTLHWVAPERCRMWANHNRRYELLNEERCADLIEGFKAQGQQEFPAIVRPVPDNDAYDYEVICGARRHWTVSWLRLNNYRQFRFLIEVRDLTDEEAFRLSDVENRDRDDICDFERATDYAHALRAYYGGKQKDMAKRLEVSEVWLSRYLGLAKLPGTIVDAYADVTHIREMHARSLNPLLNQTRLKEAVFREAKALTRQQSEGRIEGPAVFKRLKAAGSGPSRTVKEREKAYKDKNGDVIVKVTQKHGNRLIINVVDKKDIEAVLVACRKALEEHNR